MVTRKFERLTTHIQTQRHSDTQVDTNRNIQTHRSTKTRIYMKGWNKNKAKVYHFFILCHLALGRNFDSLCT